MNIAQQKILKGAFASIFATMLFPPFAIYLEKGIIRGEGFHFILFEPTNAVIYLPTLFAEWVAIVSICSIWWFLKRNKPTDEIMALARRIQDDPQAKDVVNRALLKLGYKRGRPF